eukprot:SAG31_NODE_907_length_11081_cov_6.935731_8_plen_246_part_00
MWVQQNTDIDASPSVAVCSVHFSKSWEHSLIACAATADILQDKFFLFEFSRAYAAVSLASSRYFCRRGSGAALSSIGASHQWPTLFLCTQALILAETAERQAVFHGLIGGVMEELKLHKGLCGEWGVDPTDSTLTPSPACKAYCDFLTSQRQNATSIAEIAAAMVPCMRLYAHLGQRYTAKGLPASETYAKWFEEYSSPQMEELSKSLEALLDEEIASGGNSKGLIQANYLQAMQLERDFFAQHA